MSERLFSIHEVIRGLEWPVNIITESELKRRLAHIAPMDLKFHDGTECVDEQDIHYLLYGNELNKEESHGETNT